MTTVFALKKPQEMKTSAIPVHICRPDGWLDVKETLSAPMQTFADERKFTGETGQRVRMPGPDGKVACVLFGAGSEDTDYEGAIAVGGLSAALPEGQYYFETLPEDWSAELAAIGWGLGAYRFERYLEDEKVFPVLVMESGAASKEVVTLVNAVRLGRDLINTPPSDMGPEALEAEARMVATRYKAKIKTTVGEALLEKNYPMIHAVGRAAHQPPRLVEFEWGEPDHPRLALVGKGITFDTGGLNIKSAAGARIMKKDMGGAAHALALADMIMANNLPVRLHVLLAIAENAISASAYRPGDVLHSRLGLTVEIDNTDAEGRLVLGDALTRAAEDNPDLIIDFATLTGAARVALGPTLPPFFSNRSQVVPGVIAATDAQKDPVWHMPLWQPYMSMLKTPIADMKNAGGSFAGCMTAALFLERFVKDTPWMHFDVYGWNPASSAGHPAGGEMFAIRGLYHWLKAGGLKGDN